MLVTNIIVATTVTLAILTCRSLCLNRQLPVQAGETAPALRPQQPNNNDTPPHQERQSARSNETQNTSQDPDKMFPDGLKYDFGEVPTGGLYKHSFRIVNTSTVPLRLVSLRCA